LLYEDNLNMDFVNRVHLIEIKLISQSEIQKDLENIIKTLKEEKTNQQETFYLQLT